MDALDLIRHVLNFLAPALFIASLLPLGSRLIWGKSKARTSYWLQFFTEFLLGAVVLSAGLWLFGRDGKMASYAALVLSCSTAQWALLRSWRK